jgi:nitrate reductase gamma subunit
MTNEQYLYVSYFAAAGAGVLSAGVTTLVLRGPLRHAIARFTAPARKFMGRSLVLWLVMGAIFAFTSVTYFDCGHSTYKSVVEDMPHMVAKTHEQASSILKYLLVGVLTYALALAVILAIWRKPQE